jgi:hypothetical protein
MLADMANFRLLNEIYGEFQPHPARTTVQSNLLERAIAVDTVVALDA